jgi:hypothetical protein
MRKSFLAASAAILSLAATPVLANPASALSLGNASSVRASSASHKSSKFANGAIVPVILALAIVGAGVYIAVDDNDHPDSQ